jgi:hypothetical protein
MKLRIALSTVIISSIFVIFSSTNVGAKQNIDTFWTKFKTAVVKGDKFTVASLTQFPLSMPFGRSSIKTKGEFIRNYDDIMNMEANAKRCFRIQNIKKEGSSYHVSCTFKSLPETSDNRPIFYNFEKTKNGWKFVGLDNINE